MSPSKQETLCEQQGDKARAPNYFQRHNYTLIN